MDIRWPFGPHLCLLSLFSQLALPDITVQALLFLTIQRFTQLRFPMTTSERFTACNIIKLSLLWSFSIFFWCVYTASLARHGFLDTSERCHLDYPNLAFVLFKVCLFSVAPLILIITLNASSISFLYNKKYRLLNRTRTQRFMSAPTLKISKNGPKSYSGSAGQTNRRMRSKSMMNKNKRRNSKPDDKVKLLILSSFNG